MTWRRRGRSEVDEREEMLSHIRIEADRLIEEGVSEKDAKRIARETFGSLPPIAPGTHATRTAFFDYLMSDIRQALRSLASSPVSTATILVSLVVGIGVNTAIFSVADQTLVRPLPVPDPDRLVQLDWDGQWIGEGRGWGSIMPHPLYEGLAADQSVFESIAARSPGEATLISPAGPERAEVALVTGEFFETMGIVPHLGRLIDQRDDHVLDGHPVVVLSHAFWTTRFDADPEVVGRTLQVNGSPLTIIGVAPAAFRGTDWSVVPVAWTSMMMNGLIHEWGRLDQPRVRFQHIYARLAPGVTRAEAEDALQPWFARYLRADMERPDWPSGREDPEIAAYLSSRLAVEPGGQGQAARSEALTRPVLIITFATALLLLLACLNVANLSLAKAVARSRETAVRSALGATRGRLMAERFVEAALLALAGGAIGVYFAPRIASWIIGYFRVRGGDADMALGVVLDARTLATAAGVALIATILSGIGPAWYASSTRPMGALRSPNSVGGLRLRRMLVVGQVALALVLLMGAGLFGKTLHTLRSTGPGFATDQLVGFSVTPVNDGYTREEAKVILEDINSAVTGISGVEAAGYSAWPLLAGSGWGNSMLVEGDTRFVTDKSLPMNAVTPGFFDLLGIDVLRGRDFASGDRTTGDEVSYATVIVSQGFVDRYLPDREPLGVRIDFGRDPAESARMEIVGVVEDYAEQRLRDPLPQVYFPMHAQLRRGATFYLRSSVPLSVVGPAVRERVERIDPVLTVADLRTLDEQIDRLLVVERMLAALGSAFAVFGTLLAMIGIYGVLSFMVQGRTKEMGIRIALGAPRVSATRLVIGDAMRLIVLGIAVALPVIWVLGRLVESLLYGVPAMDPLGLLLAIGAILVLCLGASALPALRMCRTDPLEAFRVE